MTLTSTEKKLIKLLEVLKDTSIYNYKDKLRQCIKEAKKILINTPEEEEYLGIFSDIAHRLLWDTYEETYRSKEEWDKMFWREYHKAVILEIDKDVDVDQNNPLGGKIVN